MSAEQVAQDMEDRIRSGEYPPGERLPTTLGLANMYGIGTSSATKVFLILRLRGLTEGVQGVGVFVADELPE